MAAAIGTKKSKDRINWFFDEADKDKDGYLSMNELKDALKKQGYKLNSIQVKKQFIRFDLNGDKRISRDEFMACMGEMPENLHDSAQIRKMFDAFDKNRDGKIDRNEIETVFSEMRKRKIQQKEIDEIMAKVDKDKDGYIDMEEFIEVFGKNKDENSSVFG